MSYPGEFRYHFSVLLSMWKSTDSFALFLYNVGYHISYECQLYQLHVSQHFQNTPCHVVLVVSFLIHLFECYIWIRHDIISFKMSSFAFTINNDFTYSFPAWVKFPLLQFVNHVYLIFFFYVIGCDFCFFFFLNLSFSFCNFLGFIF